MSRRQDAERRMQDARKAEAAAQKDLEELRTAQRMRRMSILTEELGRIGFPMDTDEDISSIVEKIQSSGSGICDDAELRMLRKLRDAVESSAAIPLRSDEDVQKLNAALIRPRNLRACKSTAIAQIITYAVTGNFPAHQPPETEETG